MNKALQFATAPFRFIGRGLKAAASALPIQLPGYGYTLPFGLGGAGRDRYAYQTAVGDGRDNSIVSATISFIQDVFPEAPLLVEQARGNDSAPVASNHPLQLLLERPNDYYSHVALWSATIADLKLDGNGYWMIGRGASRRPESLWYVPSFLIEPAYPQDGSAFITHYNYKPSGHVVQVDVADVLHFRIGIDPQNIRKGRSPLRGLLAEVFTDDEAAAFTATILRNLGLPGIILSPDDPRGMTPDQAEHMKQNLIAKFGGERRGEPFVSTGGLKVATVGWSPSELDMAAIRKIPEERVTAALGVPAVIVGLGAGLSQATYSNVETLSYLAWVRGIIPMHRVFASEIGVKLVPEFGDSASLFVRFDTSKVTALQEVEAQKMQRYATMFEKGGCTRDQWLSAMGMPTIGGDAGNAYRVPSGIMELTQDDLNSGAAGQMDTLWDKGITQLNETRSAFGLAALDGGDIRQVSIRASEQTEDELANHEMLLKPPQFTIAITGPSIDAMPTALQALFPDDAEATSKPTPVMIPAPGNAQTEESRQPVPPALQAASRNGHRELVPIAGGAVDFKAGNRQQAAYIRALARLRSKHEKVAAEKLQTFFDGQAKRAKSRMSGKSARAQTKAMRADDLLPTSDDDALAAILKAIASGVAEDVWNAVNDSGLLDGVDWDAAHPRVEKLLAAAAGRAIDINDATRAKLQSVLSDGYEAGRTIHDIARGWEDEDGNEHPGVDGVIEETYKNRAEAIARTETAYAQVGGQKARYTASDVQQVEIQDGEDDDECAERNGTIVDIDDDPDLAHPNCLVGNSVVIAPNLEGTSSRWFEGEIVVLRTADNQLLRCTPNHPVLTDHGWVAAGLLKEGSYVLRAVDAKRVAALIDPYHDNMPACIEEIADAARMADGGSAVTVPGAAMQFHGDGFDSKVNVVFPDGFAKRARISAVGHQRGESQVVGTDMGLAEFFADGSPFQIGISTGHTTDGSMSRFDLLKSVGQRHLLPLSALRGALVADDQPTTMQSVIEGDRTDTDLGGEFWSRFAGLITAVPVGHVERAQFTGYVYNLQTRQGWYLADSIITHNCTLNLMPVLPDENEDGGEGDDEE